MSAPSTPSNFLVQQGNSEVLLSWNFSAGASGYPIQRSTDNITFTALTTPTVNYYLDSTVTAGTQYYYKVASTNGTVSAYTESQGIVPVKSGDMTLGQIRFLAQCGADMINSNYVSVPEWNQYINQSYFELYDLLTNKFGEAYYFATTPYSFTTTGNAQFYDLPSDFYKLYGIDLGLNGSSNAWVTLKRFNFISRNRYIYPNLTSTFLGVVNLRYRVLGNQVEFIPTPAGGQTIRYWYAPKMTSLLQDTDVVDGVSGWTQYIIVDATIKALMKQESPIEAQMAMKSQLLDRIEWAAENRDAGEPDTISDTKRFSGLYGFGSPNDDGSSGGY